MTQTEANNVATIMDNKQLVRAIYEESARGESKLFRALAADDLTWWKIGTTSWSKTYSGKQAVSEMFKRLFALLEGPHLVSAQRIIADGDLVVVEASGRSTTKAGKAYNNSYCMIYRFADGMIMEVKEYCDTALIDAVL
jgi:ketosteroid isomerase-like protein